MRGRNVVKNDIEKLLVEFNRLGGNENDFPLWFYCPLSLSVMTDPVTLKVSGKSYNKAEIIIALNNKRECPLDRIQVHGRIEEAIVTNYRLKDAIEAELKRHIATLKNQKQSQPQLDEGKEQQEKQSLLSTDFLHDRSSSDSSGEYHSAEEDSFAIDMSPEERAEQVRTFQQYENQYPVSNSQDEESFSHEDESNSQDEEHNSQAVVNQIDHCCYTSVMGTINGLTVIASPFLSYAVGYSGPFHDTWESAYQAASSLSKNSSFCKILYNVPIGLDDKGLEQSNFYAKCSGTKGHIQLKYYFLGDPSFQPDPATYYFDEDSTYQLPAIFSYIAPAILSAALLPAALHKFDDYTWKESPIKKSIATLLVLCSGTANVMLPYFAILGWSEFNASVDACYKGCNHAHYNKYYTNPSPGYIIPGLESVNPLLISSACTAGIMLFSRPVRNRIYNGVS